MKDAVKFTNLIKFLAEQHPLVKHSEDKMHFASSLDEADNAYARNMCYPCVCLDLGDMRINDSPQVERSVVLAFMQHVSDTGNEREKHEAFGLTGDIAIDFLAQLESIAENHSKLSFVSRFNIDGAELVRVELEEAGLYGWMCYFQHTFNLNSIVCEKHFGADFDDKVADFFKSLVH